MSEVRKYISIASNKQLVAYGGINGPIRTPFYETLPIISMLVSSGVEVYEHIGDKKIRLSMTNFDADNSIEEVERPVQYKKQEQPKTDIIKIAAEPNKNQSKEYKEKQRENFNKQNNVQQQPKQQQQQQKQVKADELVEE